MLGVSVYYRFARDSTAIYSKQIERNNVDNEGEEIFCSFSVLLLLVPVLGGFLYHQAFSIRGTFHTRHDDGPKNDDKAS